MAPTVGNGGVRMKPHLADRIVDPDGRTVDTIEPEEAEQVISRQTARDLTAMMTNVVREGTGTAAALQGVEVAGKTGTAELDNSGINQPWFIGLRAARWRSPSRSSAFQGGTGGVVAAPIAKQVLEALGQ